MAIDDLLYECCLPRSSLKLIDETLECELCHSVNKNDKMDIGCLDHLMMDHVLCDKDYEYEIEELAAKCYDLDIEIEVSNKQP